MKGDKWGGSSIWMKLGFLICWGRLSTYPKLFESQDSLQVRSEYILHLTMLARLSCVSYWNLRQRFFIELPQGHQNSHVLTLSFFLSPGKSNLSSIRTGCITAFSYTLEKDYLWLPSWLSSFSTLSHLNRHIENVLLNLNTGIYPKNPKNRELCSFTGFENLLMVKSWSSMVLDMSWKSSFKPEKSFFVP